MGMLVANAADLGAQAGDTAECFPIPNKAETLEKYRHEPLESLGVVIEAWKSWDCLGSQTSGSSTRYTVNALFYQLQP